MKDEQPDLNALAERLRACADREAMPDDVDPSEADAVHEDVPEVTRQELAEMSALMRKAADALGVQPSSAEINALPERWRRYIHDLETRCDASHAHACEASIEERHLRTELSEARAEIARLGSALIDSRSDHAAAYERAEAAEHREQALREENAKLSEERTATSVLYGQAQAELHEAHGDIESRDDDIANLQETLDSLVEKTRDHVEFRITTRCPACGHQTLFIGSGGHLTCSWLECPDPGLERHIQGLQALRDGLRARLDRALSWASRNERHVNVHTGDWICTCGLCGALKAMDALLTAPAGTPEPKEDDVEATARKYVDDQLAIIGEFGHAPALKQHEYDEAVRKVVKAVREIRRRPSPTRAAAPAGPQEQEQ